MGYSQSFGFLIQVSFWPFLASLQLESNVRFVLREASTAFVVCYDHYGTVINNLNHFKVRRHFQEFPLESQQFDYLFIPMTSQAIKGFSPFFVSLPIWQIHLLFHMVVQQSLATGAKIALNSMLKKKGLFEIFYCHCCGTTINSLWVHTRFRHLPRLSTRHSLKLYTAYRRHIPRSPKSQTSSRQICAVKAR